MDADEVLARVRRDVEDAQQPAPGEPVCTCAHDGWYDPRCACCNRRPQPPVDWKARAEAAEATLAEVRAVIRGFFVVHGNNASASLTAARDLAEGIRQVLDKVPLETRERSDEKEAGRG